MKDLKISEAIEMQRALYEANKDHWNPLDPKYGKDSFLWMMEEVGECIAIVKKKGHEGIVNDPQVREHFVEEMVDVMMYFSQILLRYGITAEEFAKGFNKKHQKNMQRNYHKEYETK